MHGKDGGVPTPGTGKGDGRSSRLRVLALPAYRRRALNPFQALLYDEVRRAGVDVRDWSFLRALLWRADVWHLHHPDTVVFPRAAVQSLVECVLMRCLLSWARRRGTRILWTVHDLDSSDGVHPRLERWFWRYFLPRVDACVYLTETGRRLARRRFPALRRVPGTVIAHGDFSPAYPNVLSRAEARAALGLADEVPVLLHFGLIRPYKDVPRLIEAVRELDSGEAVLLVAGRVWDAALERELRERAASAANVRLHLQWIAFEDTQRWFKAADLVVLPYRRILNSGTVMLALAFGRPVLVPDRGTMSELRERFGANWVRVHAGELDGATLRAAVRWARETPRDAPDLDGLDWATLAARTLAVYASLTGSPRRDAFAAPLDVPRSRTRRMLDTSGKPRRSSEPGKSNKPRTPPKPRTACREESGT